VTHPEIQIERQGRIREGRWAGQNIFIQDDRATSGGYLILIGSDQWRDQAGDIWIEEDQLEQAFTEAGWIVTWKDPLAGPTS